MSTFVSHIVADLSQKTVPINPPGPAPSLRAFKSNPTTAQSQSVHTSSAHSKDALRDIFVQLDGAPPPSVLRECIASLQTLEYDQQLSAELADGDGEEAALRRAILGRLALGLYGQAMTAFLDEAEEAEGELEWWSELGRSRRAVGYYLLQTLPIRLANVSKVVLSTLRTHNIPLQLSAFSPASLRRLFPSDDASLRPNTLTLALFPHLNQQPYALALSVSSRNKAHAASSPLGAFARTLAALAHLPLALATDECAHKRKELARVRDERAEALGVLVGLRDRLAGALEGGDDDGALGRFVRDLQAVVDGEDGDREGEREASLLENLGLLASVTLPAHASLHRAEVRSGELGRPSRLTLVWPQLVLLPPVVLYAVRWAYASRASLEEVARGAGEAVRGFWEDWVLEPLRGIVRTVTAGREDGVIVTRESVRADLDSLERMTLALAQEKLQYARPQLEALSRQVQMGDLTAVMQIYEEDIKSPLRSAVQGTLLRSLFIQVQKAKVDINQALSGIDKLLKSQELTFAFVGVAPALAIVYAVAGYVRTLWSGGHGRGRYGGKAKRSSVWLTIRRLERLLIAQPEPHRRRREHHVPSLPKSSGAVTSTASVSPLTAGLVLLSVTHLRRYAERTLPANSRLREGFLEDVADLEDPGLGRADKLRVLDRMWRSWGELLGWSRVGA